MSKTDNTRPILIQWNDPHVPATIDHDGSDPELGSQTQRVGVYHGGMYGVPRFAEELRHINRRSRHRARQTLHSLGRNPGDAADDLDIPLSRLSRRTIAWNTG